MKSSISIYLAGSIKKEHEKSDETYWTSFEMNLIKSYLKSYDVTFLNPATRIDDLSDQKSVFGRDMLQVYSSDVVFVDARDRRGLGVGAEMMWAKMNRIPCVIWAPVNTHYYKERTTLLDVEVSNWVHPFVESLCDKRVETVIEGAQWIEQIMWDSSSIKGPEFIHEAMEHYKTSQSEDFSLYFAGIISCK